MPFGCETPESAKLIGDPSPPEAEDWKPSAPLEPASLIAPSAVALPKVSGFREGHYLLVIEGLALLRAGADRCLAHVEARLRELDEIAARLDEAPYSERRDCPSRRWPRATPVGPRATGHRAAPGFSAPTSLATLETRTKPFRSDVRLRLDNYYRWRTEADAEENQRVEGLFSCR